MTQTQFEGVMQGLTDRDFANVTDLNGHQLTANMVRGMGRLEAIGPGQYLVNFSKGDPPIYAYTGWGEGGGVRRFVLDLTGKAPVYPQPNFAGAFGPMSSRPIAPPAPAAPGSKGPPAPPVDEHSNPVAIGIRG